MTDAPGFPTYHESFPPPPRILPTVLDPADRRRQWPLLDDILARARDWFPDDGRPLRPFCILTSTEALNGMEIDEGRSFPHLLLFVVPEDFAPQLERLIAAKTVQNRWLAVIAALLAGLVASRYF